MKFLPAKAPITAALAAVILLSLAFSASAEKADKDEPSQHPLEKPRERFFVGIFFESIWHRHDRNLSCTGEEGFLSQFEVTDIVPADGTSAAL